MTTSYLFVDIHWTVKFHFPLAWALKQVFFLSDFLLYHYSDFSYYRSLLYYGKLKKKSGENKNKLRTTYPKNHENSKSSKPRIQFYWFLLKKDCTLHRVISRLRFYLIKTRIKIKSVLPNFGLHKKKFK